jgi:hypothetical protein
MKRSLLSFAVLIILFVSVAGCASRIPHATPSPSPITDMSGYTEFHLYGPETQNKTIQIFDGTKLMAQPNQSVTLNYTVTNHLNRDATFDITGSAFINNSSSAKIPFTPFSFSLKNKETCNGTIQLKSGIFVNDTELDIGLMETTPGVTPYMTNSYYFDVI